MKRMGVALEVEVSNDATLNDVEAWFRNHLYVRSGFDITPMRIDVHPDPDAVFPDDDAAVDLRFRNTIPSAEVVPTESNQEEPRST